MADLEMLDAQFIPIILTSGSILDPQAQPAMAVFPGDSTVLSLQVTSGTAPGVEAVPIGSEGVFGAPGGLPALPGLRCLVQVGGPARQIEANRLGDAMQIAPRLKALLEGYHAALLGQALQSVACAALHPVEARTCRRLLSLHDRVGRPELPLTQEGLADSLGVRRTTITRIIAALEARGLVQHRRSRILVVDRPGLEAASCACHRAVHGLFARSLPGQPTTGS